MYDELELELDIVWSTATNDIPLLQNRVKELISLVEEQILLIFPFLICHSAFCKLTIIIIVFGPRCIF